MKKKTLVISVHPDYDFLVVAAQFLNIEVKETMEKYYYFNKLT
jgi:hypothetical protein